MAGVSIHDTDVEGLERLRRPDRGSEPAFLRQLCDELGASELVFLATCNRVEVVFAREEGEAPDRGDLDRLARFLAVDPAPAPGQPPPADLLELATGADAVRRLFRVAASLDSLVVGEDQILAQVRGAYGLSADIGLVGPLLGPLSHPALAVGKRVRAETDLARHPTSVVNLAVRGLVDRRGDQPLRLGVIGAGTMGRLLARVLAEAGHPPDVVVNRTLASAERLAADCGGRAVDLASFAAGDEPVDVVVSATAAPGYVLDGDAMERLAARTPSGAPLLAFDLAVPRDLASIADGSRLELVDMDALRGIADGNRALRASAAQAAERLVDEKVTTFVRRFGEEAAAPAVTELRQASEEILARELKGLLGGRLAHLEDADRRAVERWARATFGRLMHLPVVALKRLAHDMGEAERTQGDPSGLVG